MFSKKKNFLFDKINQCISLTSYLNKLTPANFALSFMYCPFKNVLKTSLDDQIINYLNLNRAVGSLFFVGWLSKIVEHRGWLTTKNLRLHWLKYPKTVPRNQKTVFEPGNK